MRLLTSLLIALPSVTFAVGTETETAPAPTPTTQSCAEGKVWDGDSKSCVVPGDARLDDSERIGAVREFAYAGRNAEAIAVLDTIADQGADLVLTYRGFTARQMGDIASANAWYDAALKANPDNLLARSYMGQGYVQTGDLDDARAQLSEIRQRGGRGTWAEVALRLALQSGRGFAY